MGHGQGWVLERCGDFRGNLGVPSSAAHGPLYPITIIIVHLSVEIIMILLLLLFAAKMTWRTSMNDESPGSGEPLQLRSERLQARVNEAAKALLAQGIRPTVTRIRAALGGGSPNDLAPAVKYWREVVLPGLPSFSSDEGAVRPALPFQLADLVHELWQRAMAAAVVEVRGGPTAREVAARTAEAQGLRKQVTALRDQLQRESLAYGELRAQAARHEAIAREALARVHEGEVRERELLREVGGLRQRVAELEAVAGRELGARRPRAAVGSRHGVRKKARARKAQAGRKVRKPALGRRAGRPGHAGTGLRRQSQSRRSLVPQRRKGRSR